MGREFFVVGVQDTPAKDIVQEDLKLEKPDYIALESRKNRKEQQCELYTCPVTSAQFTPGFQHLHE